MCMANSVADVPSVPSTNIDVMCLRRSSAIGSTSGEDALKGCLRNLHGRRVGHCGSSDAPVRAVSRSLAKVEAKLAEDFRRRMLIWAILLEATLNRWTYLAASLAVFLKCQTLQ